MNSERLVPFCFDFCVCLSVPFSEPANTPTPCVLYRRSWRNCEKTETGIVIGNTCVSRNMRKSYKSSEIAARLWRRREVTAGVG